MIGKLPSVIVTGASGFVGRHLLEDLKNEYRIFGIARRSQAECNAPMHPNIAWIRADISDYQSIAKAFREVATAGGADYLFHLAAYYEFSGRDRPEYKLTNVQGTRHVLELAKELKLKLFVFTSSVAACSFPKKDEAIDETSPADGEHPYAWSKRQGEMLVRDFAGTIPACIVRFGAIFSDWCEYPPLYMFLNTWLGSSRKANMLGGKGQSAIPYIHIRDIVRFFRRILKNRERLNSGDVVIACSSGSTTHLKLFKLATRYYCGKSKKPILVPRSLCAIGLWLMNVWGRITRNLPFERPWMRHYIDLQLNVDNSRSCSLMDWSANPRHLIERRLPFLVERLKSEPFIWHARNMAAMRRDAVRPSFRIYTALSEAEDEIIDSLVECVTAPDASTLYPHYQQLDKAQLIWFVKLVYQLLLASIHTSNRMLILNYFEISAMSRYEAGFTVDEMTRLMTQLNDTVMQHLRKDEELIPFSKELYDCVSMPIEFGKDEIEEQYQLFLHKGIDKAREEELPVSTVAKSAREQLEETIWNCLVQRK